MNIDVNRMLKIGVDELLGESVAVLGIKGSGKSNTAAVLAEELLSAGVLFLAGNVFQACRVVLECGGGVLWLSKSSSAKKHFEPLRTLLSCVLFWPRGCGYE